MAGQEHSKTLFKEILLRSNAQNKTFFNECNISNGNFMWQNKTSFIYSRSAKTLSQTVTNRKNFEARRNKFQIKWIKKLVKIFSENVEIISQNFYLKMSTTLNTVTVPPNIIENIKFFIHPDWKENLLCVLKTGSKLAWQKFYYFIHLLLSAHINQPDFSCWQNKEMSKIEFHTITKTRNTQLYKIHLTVLNAP